MKGIQNRTRRLIGLFAIVLSWQACGQPNASGEEKWGVVLEHPDMKNVGVVSGIEYGKGRQGATLQLDIYTPPLQTDKALKGCIIFFTEMYKDRSWQIYQTWPRLAAAYGLNGIAVDVDKEQYLASVQKVFEFINSHHTRYNIDASKIGVYIPSHVPGDVVDYLIKEDKSPQVKVAVMFNASPSLRGPFRKDLPVFYVTDDQEGYPEELFSPLWAEVQKSRAPWTLKFGSGMPIFFESFAANDDSRRIVREAIYFFKNHLESLPTAPVSVDEDREMIASLYRADYEHAAMLFKAWLKKHPEDQYAQLKYAMISFIRKNYVEAEQAYRKVKDLHPVYRIDLVKTLLANGKEAEAERELTLAMRSGKVKRSPYPGIATFLYSLGRYSQGIAYYEMASEEDLKGEDFYNMARGYVRTQEIERAYDALEKAVKNNSQFRQKIEGDSEFYMLRGGDRYRKLVNSH